MIKKIPVMAKMMIFCVFFLGPIFLSSSIQAGIIFEENFNNQPDWTCPDNRPSCGENGEDCAALGVIPSNLTYYYSATIWGKMILINNSVAHGVRANDAAGNASAYSSTFSTKTAALAPTAPNRPKGLGEKP